MAMVVNQTSAVSEWRDLIFWSPELFPYPKKLLIWFFGLCSSNVKYDLGYFEMAIIKIIRIGRS